MELALQQFHCQCELNNVYGNYIKALKIAPMKINSLEKIPFLPIEFFKTHQVMTGSFDPQKTFESSGTTGQTSSKHIVKDLTIYDRSFTASFEKNYGSISDYCFLALLPSYLDREGSSLIYMVEKMIEQTHKKGSGFYLNNQLELAQQLVRNEDLGVKTILIGVTFALLDFAQKYSMPLRNTIVMETGGMKGRREEMTREEVHSILAKAFSLQNIHSEYGMTELLSQAYSSGNGIFVNPPWMHTFVRDATDPLVCYNMGRGALNIIDLANTNSCSFIATQDLGIVHESGDFEVSGRMDHSDVRGCSTMVL